jgi:hypothetical protein
VNIERAALLLLAVAVVLWLCLREAARCADWAEALG